MLEISLFGAGATTAGNAVAVGGNVGITGNLSVGGNLSIFQFTANKTITTTNYQLVVAEDISLNGRVIGSSDASFGGNLWVGGTTGITVTGGMTLSGTAATNIATAINLSNYLTTATAASTYLTTATAASTYLTPATAASTYLTPATAASTYLTPATAASTYLTPATAASTYAPLSGPTFTGTTNTAALTSSGTITGQTVNVGGATSAGNALAVGGNVYITGNVIVATSLPTSDSSTKLATTAYVQNQGYLTTASASSTYLTQTNASSTYATTSSLSSYLTTASASSTYLTQTNATSTYAPKASPTFTGTLTLSAGGTLSLPVTSVPNSALQGSGTMTIAGTSVALGSSITQATICSGYATTSSLASYAPLASPTFSGTTTFPGTTVINSSGYIGMGTTAPYNRFHITGSSTGKIAQLIANTNTAVGSSACFQFGLWAASGSGTGTSSPASEIAAVCMDATFGNTDMTFSTYNSNNSLTEKMRINNTGYVGIGTTNPLVPLHVSGSVSGQTITNISYFNGSSTGVTHNTSNPGVNITVYTSNDVAAGGGVMAAAITGYSDERIKTNITDIDDNVALIELRKIRPRTYEYRDKVKNPNALIYGFIAQEVEETIPYAVRIMKGHLPNIYEKANVEAGKRIVLHNGSTSSFHADSNGKDASGNTIEIKLFDENNKEIITNLVSIVDDKTFEISDELNETEIFVYGQQVNDFRCLEKDAIFTITTAAVQQIDREFQEAKQTIQTLESENAELKAKFAALDARLSRAGF